MKIVILLQRLDSTDSIARKLLSDLRLVKITPLRDDNFPQVFFLLMPGTKANSDQLTVI